MQIVWGAGYVGHHLAKGPANGKMTCATKRNGEEPSEIWWRYDTGNGSWSIPPVFVGFIDPETPRNDLCVSLLDENGDVMVTNAKNAHWRSEDGIVFTPEPDTP